MRVLVYGLGSAGTRHEGSLEKLGHSIVTCDPLPEKKVDYRYIHDALEEDLDAAVVCTPPPTHVDLAYKCLNRGLHVLVEKPLSYSIQGVDNLVSKAKEEDRVLMVCCNLRFEPALQTLVKPLIDHGEIGRILNVICEYGHYLPFDYPDYKDRYVSGAGGGAILNATIHEIDLLQSWFGDVEQVGCTAERSGTLDIEEEDSADISMRFRSGVHASVHADYLQWKYHRTIKFIGTKGILLWDFGNLEVKVGSKDVEKWRIFKIPESAREDMYVREMEYFISLIKGDVKPMPYLDGVAALKIALTARRIANTGVAQV